MSVLYYANITVHRLLDPMWVPAKHWAELTTSYWLVPGTWEMFD